MQAAAAPAEVRGGVFAACWSKPADRVESRLHLEHLSLMTEWHLLGGLPVWQNSVSLICPGKARLFAPPCSQHSRKRGKLHKCTSSVALTLKLRSFQARSSFSILQTPWFENIRDSFTPHAHKITVLLLASAVNLVTICEQWIMSFFFFYSEIPTGDRDIRYLYFTLLSFPRDGRYHVSENWNHSICN